MANIVVIYNIDNYKILLKNSDIKLREFRNHVVLYDHTDTMFPDTTKVKNKGMVDIQTP